jgi:CDP-paratose 2-epimerase
MKKKIAIVTGSSGLVGSETAKFLLEKKFVVIGIDNNLRAKLFGSEASTVKEKLDLKKNRNFIYYNSDIRNFISIKKVFKKYKKNIKIIVHAAAQPSHDWAYTNPLLDFDVNARSTLNLLMLTKKFCPNSVFIFLSTNKVYGDKPNSIPLLKKKNRWDVSVNSKYYNGINESFSIDRSIHSFFGVSKTYADLIVQEFGKNFGIKTVCFRCGCITGPAHAGAKLHGFLSYLVKSCLKKKYYELIGYEGKQVRDNIHSRDLVRAFWEFYKKPKKGEVYNMGGGRFSNCSIIEAINIIEKKMKIIVKKKYVKKARTGDHIWYISDLNKFRKDFPDWKQEYNIQQILNELINNIAFQVH